MTTKYQVGLNDDEPRMVSGVKGAKSRSFLRRFSNAAAMNKWIEKQDGDIEIYEVYFN